MHVALVHRDIHRLTRGGICTLYRNLAAHLSRHGARVTVITQATPHPVDDAGLAIETLSRTEDLASHRRAVTAVLDRMHPDVVECSTWEAELLDYATRPRAERAPILVRGEFSAATLGADELADDEAGLVRSADRVIAVSRYAASDLATAYDIPIPTVVHNGVDRTRFLPGQVPEPTSGYRVTLDASGTPIGHQSVRTILDDGQPVPPWRPDPHGRACVLWIGKITPMKGWDLLEQIVASLDDIATFTVLLGHSPTLVPITIDPSEMTILHDLDDRDVPGLYRGADWFLSTSRWEGFGLAIAEALACGTPVLLPERLGTAPELLATGGGYTYHDPDDLRAVLTYRVRPPARLSPHFDWSVNAEATLEIYRYLIAA